MPSSWTRIASTQPTVNAEEQCEFEARMAGRQPLSITDGTAMFAEAIAGATIKLLHALTRAIGRTESNRRGDEPNPLGLFAIASTAFIVNAIAADGETTWFEGVLL
jgi:hypothetical protein